MTDSAQDAVPQAPTAAPAPAPAPDQALESEAPALESSELEASELENSEPLAIRRIKKLRKRYPEETPGQIAVRLEQAFSRDFSLVGGTEVGITQLVPGAFTAATRNSKVAGLTRAGRQIGVVQGISTYTQKTAQGIGTAAHVGSSQSIKTYVYSMALLHGLQVESAEDAWAQILDGDIHQLLRTIEQPIAHSEQQKGATPLNVISAISQIGLRNPQLFLLVKSSEQLVRSGGSVVATTKARREFAQQLIAQVQEQLGESPADFPAAFAELEPEQNVASPQEEITDFEESSIAPAQEVTATSTEEIERLAATDSSYSVRGAKLAARAFMKGSDKVRGFGFGKRSRHISLPTKLTLPHQAHAATPSRILSWCIGARPGVQTSKGIGCLLF